MPYTVVQFTVDARTGDAMHRLTWPMQALGSLPEFRVIDVHYLSPFRYRLAFEADLLVLCFLHDVELVPIIRWRRAKGKPTVFEVNDYFFDVQPWNPVFEGWNTPAMQANYLQMMQLADLVQTSTTFLAEAFKAHCSRVAVFPNQLYAAPSTLPRKPERPFAIGWAGSLGHIGDIACVAPAISKWINEHDDVVLSIMGNKAIADLFPVQDEKKRFVPWDDMDAYDKFLKGVHVGLAPLRDTPYNRGRSDIKWVECAAGGCVFVGQRLQPYTDSVQDGKTGFLFDNTAALLRVLDRLHKNQRLWDMVRHAAFDYVAKNRRHDEHITERAEVYKELLDQEPLAGAEKWNLHENATFPSIDLPDPPPNYFPVKLEPQEQKALEELYSDRPGRPDRPAVSEDSIRLVARQYGDFHLVHHAWARLAAGRRDAATAERHLRRSISLYPASVRSLVLLGQLLLALGRRREAREMLSVAVQWNPACASAYPHLVNGAEQENDWEAAIAVTEEWEKHCNQDALAVARRGLLLIRAGRMEEGINVITEAMRRIKDQFKYWQLPFAAGVVGILREADPLVSDERAWSELIVTAAEMFPHGLWLAARAGAICFQKGEYERGGHILRSARERLLGWEWQGLENVPNPAQYRGVIEAYRIACGEADGNDCRKPKGGPRA